MTKYSFSNNEYHTITLPQFENMQYKEREGKNIYIKLEGIEIG